MRSRYRVSLGNVQLDSIDENLLILDISHSSSGEQITQSKVSGLDGYDVGDAYIEKTIVTVTFELHIYNIMERNYVCQLVNKWAAAGGTLATNDRYTVKGIAVDKKTGAKTYTTEGQRLYYTRCEKFADIESARNWTDPLTLVFATTYEPHWCSQNTKTLTLTGKSAKGTLKMDGNTGISPVSVTVTANAAISSFQITAGGSTLKLTGLSLAKDKKLVIDYVNSRYLRIRADGKSAMAKLDPASSDRLTVPCGANTVVSITANNKVTAVITARGRWI